MDVAKIFFNFKRSLIIQERSENFEVEPLQPESATLKSVKSNPERARRLESAHETPETQNGSAPGSPRKSESGPGDPSKKEVIQDAQEDQNSSLGCPSIGGYNPA